MILISTILDETAVIGDCNCQDKSALLTIASELAAEQYSLNAGLLLERLQEREKLGSTGFGGGTAIPHCKIDGLSAPVGVFLRLGKAIGFNAVDNKDVDLVFALISPAGDGAAHLRALAQISRMFRDSDSCEQLRGAADSAAIYALLTQYQERDAA